MYNQHVVCSLNNINRQPILLGNVMNTTNVTEFLGGKKCYSYKMPFQLCQMDVMKTDQNDLMDENMTNNFDDHNWDSPLTRFPEARTTYKILKHSYTVRDQGVQVGISEGIRLADSNVNSIQSDKNKSYERIHKKFEEKQKTQFVSDNRFDVNNEKKDLKKITTTTTKTKTFKPPDRANPVHELQLKAKQQLQLGQADEDDPPYNFQAILKKTNYKRPSLEGQSVRYSSEINELPQVDTASRSKDYKNELNQKLSKATKTELLPGIMLEGSSYDL